MSNDEIEIQGHTDPAARHPKRMLLLATLGAAFAFSAGWGAYALSLELHHAYLMRQSYAPAPEDMVFVPPGDFILGSDDEAADHNERPAREVFLPAFYIDRTEVTNAQYARFDPDHTFPPDRAEFPVVKLTRADAEAYAAWAGKRLPTGAEWEKAARGTDGRAYPWGDAFDPALANIGNGDDLVAVGSYPDGASPYGALDMTGNAWEWIADSYDDAKELGVPGYVRGIVRGGAYSYSPFQGRTSHIAFETHNLTCGDLGFRCVKDAVPE